MESREIRFFDYVNHPYDQVRDALTSDAASIFQAATTAAEGRTSKAAAELRVDIGALEVGTEIAITVKEVEDRPVSTSAPESTRITLEWEAATAPRLFPFMKAELAIYPLTPSETQLDLSGRYEPPGGIVGGAVNAMVGHRLAEAAVHRFVQNVADYLRKTLQ